MNGLVKQFEDYRLFARAEIPVILFTVMLWGSLQQLISIVVSRYAPIVQDWQVASLEILAASIGLWYSQRVKKTEVGENGEVRSR